MRQRGVWISVADGLPSSSGIALKGCPACSERRPISRIGGRWCDGSLATCAALCAFVGAPSRAELEAVAAELLGLGEPEVRAERDAEDPVGGRDILLAHRAHDEPVQVHDRKLTDPTRPVPGPPPRRGAARCWGRA